jgi:hypothetical protein
MTYELGAAAPRGGALFRLGTPAFVSNEVPLWCAAVARRALDDMTSIATRTARAVFHKVRGELRNGGPLPPRARR